VFRVVVGLVARLTLAGVIFAGCGRTPVRSYTSNELLAACTMPSPQAFTEQTFPERGGETCQAFANPERGFFAFRDLLRMIDLDELREDGVTVVYGKALLADYRDRALDAAALERVRAGFAAVRRAGLKVLPRFYYAADDKAPDAPPARALEHITTLAPLLRENADVIAAMHAGFVGAWGEWHPEERATLAERKAILEALLGALPASRMVLVRRPYYKQANFGGPVTAALAFGDSPLARLGHLNDCFLASADDMGTYRSKDENEYVIDDSRYVAVAGETCALNPPRSQCESALVELERHHFSLLNRDYHPEVLAEFRSGGCWDAIACRLGYRFVVRGFRVPTNAKAGTVMPLSLSVSNEGFARAINARPVQVALAPLQGGQIGIPVMAATGVDARTWAPAALNEACLAVQVPADLPPGAYRVGVWLPDPESSLKLDARYAVRMAGGVSWDGGLGVNWLDATVQVTAP
jgi:hypothetical protein